MPVDEAVFIHVAVFDQTLRHVIVNHAHVDQNPLQIAGRKLSFVIGIELLEFLDDGLTPERQVDIKRDCKEGDVVNVNMLL